MIKRLTSECRFWKIVVSFCMLMAGFAGVFPDRAVAESFDPLFSREDTMLMFIGEDIDVLSIASRREESARQAPAVAQVITLREMEEQGVYTLADALEAAPGFYMAEKEWGIRSYLRGIPDSVLFLYDTVPLGADVSKSLVPFEWDLSMASVKRIEIVRGPGSVLWGPDAFAGIVNVVPMTGKDLDGVDAGVTMGAPGERKGFHLNVGHDAVLWDAFLSVSGYQEGLDDTEINVVRFFRSEDGDGPVSPDERYGIDQPGDSRFLEASGRFSYSDRFSLEGRISDNRRIYAMSDEEQDLTWKESRSVPQAFFKIEAKQIIDRCRALRFTGYFSSVAPEYEVIDTVMKQKENTTYAELIFDQSFRAGEGLLTGGVSFREKRIEGAPVWDSYLPDYLGSSNINQLPIVALKDYDTMLWSVFAQYTHKIGDVDLTAGIRGDQHDDYEDHISFNTGLVWSLSREWMFKALYGTANRTPLASQLLEDETPDLEEINSLNVQLSWKPNKYADLSVCGFAGHIDNHVMEDPYAGLSLPNEQRINGVEISGRLSPLDVLDLQANASFIDNNGPDEVYKHNDYYYYDKDGNLKKHYVYLSYPYDVGPKTIFNLMGTWRPHQNVSVHMRLGYFSERRLIHPQSETFINCPETWLMDANIRIKHFIHKKAELKLSAENIFDRHYLTPGTYSLIEGDPFTAQIELSYRW